MTAPAGAAAVTRPVGTGQSPVMTPRSAAPSFGETLGAARRRYAAGAITAASRPQLLAVGNLRTSAGGNPAGALNRTGPDSAGGAAGTVYAPPSPLTNPIAASYPDTSSPAASLPDTNARATTRPVSPAPPGSSATTPISPTPPAPGVTPVTPTQPLGNPLPLASFPRPKDDNGRGMHWVPTTFSDKGTVDRFVEEAKQMGVKWMVILNNDARIGDNDYLVDRLVANGMMPIMRVYTPNGEPIKGNLEALVRHYKARGVSYFQLYNEPNLNVENPDRKVNVDRYLDDWTTAAQAVVRGGGLPGFGSLAPGGNFDDLEFLKLALEKLKQRGQVGLLDQAWLGMHNYTLNHPLDYQKDSNGFLKFRFYDVIVRNALGRSLPIIGTEGGTFAGQREDSNFPAITEGTQTKMVRGAYEYMKDREPYYFAYSYWVIANEEGGGHDPAFTNHALIKKGGVASPVVQALKDLTREETAKR